MRKILKQLRDRGDPRLFTIKAALFVRRLYDESRDKVLTQKMPVVPIRDMWEECRDYLRTGERGNDANTASSEDPFCVGSARTIFFCWKAQSACRDKDRSYNKFLRTPLAT